MPEGESDTRLPTGSGGQALPPGRAGPNHPSAAPSGTGAHALVTIFGRCGHPLEVTIRLRRRRLILDVARCARIECEADGGFDGVELLRFALLESSTTRPARDHASH